MGHTFRVDDVEIVRAALPGLEIATVVSEALGVELLHVSHEAILVDSARHLHPLLQAVHLAFAEHRPLSLSPDHVWLTIAQGFALHVDQHADKLRHRFVRHEDRAALVVDVLEMPRTSAAWGAVISGFSDGIARHVGPGLHRLLSCSFSTTTEVERVAGEVVMMSAFRRYFDFEIRCICGIPEITLEGSPEDWAEIRRRVDVLAEYDLAWWVDAMAPVLDQLVNTARGVVDRDFWQCIYKPTEAYGGEIVSGWIMRLFPYLQRAYGPMVQNRAVLAAQVSTGRATWITPGVSPRSAPLGLSSATLTLGSASSSLSVFGGLAGVRQLDGGGLRPEICWAIGSPPRMTALLDRIVAEHDARPRVDRSDDPVAREVPAELIELYQRCDGAVLFGRWTLARAAELRRLVGSVTEGFLGLDPQQEQARRPLGFSHSDSIPVLVLCTLTDDPRFFGLYRGDRFVIVLCDPRRAEDPEDMVVVADSVTTFLARIFEHAGASWFDDERGTRLYEHLGRYHYHLRRALTVGPHAPPTDLDQREKERLVALLFRSQVSSAQRAFWWDALRGATGTTRSFDSLFGERPPGDKTCIFDVLVELGLRAPLPLGEDDDE